MSRFSVVVVPNHLTTNIHLTPSPMVHQLGDEDCILPSKLQAALQQVLEERELILGQEAEPDGAGPGGQSRLNCVNPTLSSLLWRVNLPRPRRRGPAPSNPPGVSLPPVPRRRRAAERSGVGGLRASLRGAGGPLPAAHGRGVGRRPRAAARRLPQVAPVPRRAAVPAALHGDPDVRRLHPGQGAAQGRGRRGER